MKFILEPMFPGRLKRGRSGGGAWGFVAVVADPEEARCCSKPFRRDFSGTRISGLAGPRDLSFPRKSYHAALGRNFLRNSDGHFPWLKWPSRGFEARSPDLLFLINDLLG